MVVVANITSYAGTKLGVVGKDHPVNELGLERMEERLHVRIVARRASTGRALKCSERPHAIAKPRTGVFAAAVAVEDQTWARPAESHRAVEGRSRQPRVPYPGQAPAQKSPREPIHHYSQEPPTPFDRQVGDVTHPDLVHSPDPGLPESIRVLLVEAVQVRIRPIHPHHPRTQTRRAHQPLHPPAADSDSARRELPLHSRTPIRPTARLEDPENPLAQFPVLFPASALSA